MYNVYFITFGCKVNHYETECMKSLFRSHNHKIIDCAEEADVIIINSCTVTSSGDSRVLSALRKNRKTNPSAVIALTGCYPQAFQDEAKNITEADIIIGTKNRSQILQFVEDFMIFRTRIVSLEDYTNSDEYECLTCSQFQNNTRAFVKIQDGCNQFCSYCIIPYARGRCRSKPLNILKKEISEIAANGKKEVVLSGINLAFYGKEFGADLGDAVEISAAVEGIRRVRLSSLEPEMMSDDLLERLTHIKEFCPQFHLSLQSGCSRTLKAMNRKYTAEEYFQLTEKIRKYFPDCAFTTDVMVGFPGETEEDFMESVAFVKKIGFSKVHVFRYSRRKGTVADKMDNQIPENVKTNRWKIMTETADKSRADYMRSLMGKKVSVLFERENCTDFHHGFSADYTLIKIPRENSKKSLRNMLFCVKIEVCESDCCIGRIDQ